jgi:thiopeptide-type bacteriocin biosynthesis protein
VHRAVYEPEPERYGGADLIGLTEDLFHASSAVALRVCRDRQGTGRRIADGLEAMAATVAVWPGDPRQLLAGIRDGWRPWSGADAAVPEDRVRSVAPALRALVAGAPSRWTPWTSRLGAAAEVWTDRLGTGRAAQVFGSHLHMTQNRLGVGGAEARLAPLLLAALEPATTT